MNYFGSEYRIMKTIENNLRKICYNVKSWEVKNKIK